MNIYGLLVLGFIMLVSLLDFFIEFVHIKRFKDPISEEVKDLYSKHIYHRYMKKERRLFWYSSVKSAVRIIVFFLFSVLGWFLMLEDVLNDLIEITSIRYTAYVGIYFFVIFLFDVVINYIETSRVKKRRMKKNDVQKFLLETIKKFVFLFGAGGLVIVVSLMLYQWMGFKFFLIAIFVIQCIVVIFTLFFTKIVVPLFYRLKPLEEGELKEKINVFLRQEGYQIENVFILEQGRKSASMNAFVSGFSSRKRIVLYDTLVKRLNSDEIVAVIAHELGHQNKQHILFNMGLSFLLTSGFMLMLSFIVHSHFFYSSFGFKDAHLGFLIILYLYLLDFVLLIAKAGISFNSRRFEYQADQYAVAVWYKESLKSALMKISKRNIEHLTPSPLYAKIHFTHPSLVERLKKLSEEEHYE